MKLSFSDVTRRWSNIALLILQEIFKVILFWCHEISKRRIANGTESNGLNLFSRIKGIMEQGLGNLFTTSRSFHFFQTDLEHSSSISLNQTDHLGQQPENLLCFISVYTFVDLNSITVSRSEVSKRLLNCTTPLGFHKNAIVCDLTWR